MMAEVWKRRDVAAAFLDERSLLIPDRQRQLDVLLRLLRSSPHEPRRLLDLGAGDAVLLDFIYGHDEGRPLPADTTELGKAINHFVIRAPACEGVRTRREFIAHLLDDLAFNQGKIHVLSVAAGHLREADLSAAVKRRRLGRFVALDADAESLREVERCYGRMGVETCLSTVRQLLQPSESLGDFDLIYSTGLFDYLAQPTAQVNLQQLAARNHYATVIDSSPTIVLPSSSVQVSTTLPDSSARNLNWI